MKTLLAVSVLTAFQACQGEAMSPMDAWQAVAESAAVTRGVAAAAVPVTATRDMPSMPAGSSEAAAQALGTSWGEVAPCSDRVVDGRVVTVDLGTGCTIGDTVVGGLVTIDVVDPEGALDFTVTGLSADGVVLDGVAGVTWDQGQGTSRVRHDLAWTQGGESFTAIGSIDIGTIEGSRALGGVTDWTSAAGEWKALLSDVVIREGAVLPEMGHYELVDPQGRVLEVTFETVDESTVQVTVDGLAVPMVWEAEIVDG